MTAHMLSAESLLRATSTWGGGVGLVSWVCMNTNDERIYINKGHTWRWMMLKKSSGALVMGCPCELVACRGTQGCMCVSPCKNVTWRPCSTHPTTLDSPPPARG